MPTPSTNGANGRDANGRFTKGNAGGPGNPHARRSAELRQAMLEAVSPDDIAEIMQRLVQMAKEGDVAAIREVLNRVVGRPAPAEPEPPAAVVGLGINVVQDSNFYGNRHRLGSDGPGQDLESRRERVLSYIDDELRRRGESM